MRLGYYEKTISSPCSVGVADIPQFCGLCTIITNISLSDMASGGGVILSGMASGGGVILSDMASGGGVILSGMASGERVILSGTASGGGVILSGTASGERVICLVWPVAEGLIQPVDEGLYLWLLEEGAFCLTF